MSEAKDVTLPARPIYELTLNLGETRRTSTAKSPPVGSRLIFPIVSGRLEGRVAGNVVQPSGDWAVWRGMVAGKITVELDVRLTVETDDGAILYVIITGIASSPDGKKYEVRSTQMFEASDERYTWLNGACGYGVGTKEGDTLVSTAYEVAP